MRAEDQPRHGRSCRRISLPGRVQASPVVRPGGAMPGRPCRAKASGRSRWETPAAPSSPAATSRQTSMGVAEQVGRLLHQKCERNACDRAAHVRTHCGQELAAVQGSEQQRIGSALIEAPRAGLRLSLRALVQGQGGPPPLASSQPCRTVARARRYSCSRAACRARASRHSASRSSRSAVSARNRTPASSTTGSTTGRSLRSVPPSLPQDGRRSEGR